MRAAALAAGFASAAPGRPVAAQSPVQAQVMGQAVIALTYAKPVPGGDGLTELRVVQPVVMLRADGPRRLSVLATLNLEGATIAEGELTPGAWGEGFVDRRHPHTYAHELMLTADDLLGAADGVTRLSFSAGKGFAPFGTDDPMTRPPLRYPVNHHLAQILERAVAIAAVAHGPVTGEIGLFNGDEPERPGQWPRIARFGDSWALRITAVPVTGVELQGSHAEVHSPEHRPGAGTDQSKWSVSARWNGRLGGRRGYGLLEWARTSEANGFFVFSSLLAEGAWEAGRHRLHYRFERTSRPEEQRVSSFRSLRPHLENSIFGTTRWTIHTVGYSAPMLGGGAVGLRPLLEISYGRIGKVGGGFFDVEQVYGGSDFWSGTIGLRLTLGGGAHRMGRYGAAMTDDAAHPHREN